MTLSAGGINITLPWPPSINTYWRRNGSRYFINKKGVEFRKIVIYRAINFRGWADENDRLSLTIEASPPDRRRRDLDNIIKVVQDSLQHAKVYPDDSQIDQLIVERKPSLNGEIIVILKKINQGN